MLGGVHYRPSARGHPSVTAPVTCTDIGSRFLAESRRPRPAPPGRYRWLRSNRRPHPPSGPRWRCQRRLPSPPAPRQAMHRLPGSEHTPRLPQTGSPPIIGHPYVVGPDPRTRSQPRPVHEIWDAPRHGRRSNRFNEGGFEVSMRKLRESAMSATSRIVRLRAPPSVDRERTPDDPGIGDS